ncbi:hypothetical protein EG68_02809 [Paragonimus skrjabini miyazakii]|uniref:Aromatic-L-amino-acid decarboxylase n=1 Tax=Paragonimus skrjabini miyazakii TaxID=59628 RepID=A0A8S9Z492_9TREM|nr:hypothetical protein EG68_02809 [Paragonimus skrjabini miyazakii]
MLCIMYILQFVNSVCINPDKMMMVNLDCTILWVDNQEVLTKAFAEEPTYLKDNFRGMPEYWRWSISLSRRFRALKLWFVIRMYGLKGLRKYIRHHAKMAQVFETLISDDDRFEVTNDVRFGLVCFRLKGENCQTESLYNQLLTDGRIFMSPGSVTNTLDAEKSIYFLRFVASPLTTVEDVKFAYRVLTETVERSEYTSLNIVKTEGRNIL